MKASRVKYLPNGTEVIACCRCKQDLPRDAFNPILTRKPYVQAFCKSCRSHMWKDDPGTAAKRERARRYHQVKKLEWRLEALRHYSKSDKPSCACCGESHWEFLAFDHINGGGNKHRREENFGNIAYWLKKHNYPEGFQVLCHNCNMAKGFYGACPHTKKELCANA